MKINTQWHKDHRMPNNPTPKQRLEWHLEHTKQCSCRELTKEQLKKLQDAAKA